MPRHQAELVRRIIAEHSHRTIFSASPQSDMPSLRPRVIDAALFREEDENWRRWHEDQTDAERKLME